MKYRLFYFPALSIAGLGNVKAKKMVHFRTPSAKWKKNSEYHFVIGVRDSIAKHGMRNPLTIEWYNPWGGEPQWSVRTGNNRWAALMLLDHRHAPCVVVVPQGVEPPCGDGWEITPAEAREFFDEERVWRDSKILESLIEPE